MPPISVRTACTLGLLAVPLGAAPARAQASTLPAPASTAADTLTLTLFDAQARALRNNPAFLADAQALGIARGRLRQARSYPFNPELELEAPGAATREGLGVYQASLAQEIEAPGRTRLRARAASLGLDRAGAEVRDAARLALAATGEAFYEALAAERRLSVAEQILGLNQTLLAAIRTQRREGEISALQANLAEIEVGRARARVLAERRQRTAALVELRRLMGLTPDQPLRLADGPARPLGLIRTDTLIAAALARRPDVAASVAAVQESQTLGALTRGEATPTLRVAAIAERDEVGGDARFGVGIGASLPVLNRNRGNVAAARAETSRAQYARLATELRVRADVTQAAQAYAAAAEEVAVYESDVLQPTRENQALLETAYRAGKIDLPSLLLVRNQLREAELGYWDAWLAFRRARVRLEAATGASLSPFPADAIHGEVAR
ncbi:MAG TPA: TolC family protein [Longimicrobium sp.]|jgi:cobalt-zinc-cadmium efflux system outer membrane protein